MSEARMGWSQPRNMADSQYHFTDCSTRCLCGKYDTDQLLNERQHRRAVVITDAPACADAYRKKFEAGHRTYVRHP